MAPKRKGGTQEASKKKKAPAKSTAKKRPAPAKVKTEAPAAKAAKKVKVEAPPPPPPPTPPTIEFATGAARGPDRTGEPRAAERGSFIRGYELRNVAKAEAAGERFSWDSRESGVLRAQLLAEGAEPCRLLGTRTLSFALAPGRRAATLKALGAAVRATRREVAKHAGAETFDRDGEPAKARADDGSTTTVGRLSRAVATGDLVPDDGDALAFLMAAYGLAAPAGLPQAAPCVRSVCVLARDGGGAVAYEIRVYATRLLFYLIADDAVRALVNALAPAAGVKRRAAPPPSQRLFATSRDGATAPPFTLDGVMRSAEHCGGPEAPQPAAIALEMKPYQKQALAWMVDMETVDGGVNALFWETRDFADGGSWYYAPDLGEARLEAPPFDMRGGLLNEEMGMGKTLEMVSLVCAAPAAERAPVDLAAAGGGDDDDYGRSVLASQKRGGRAPVTPLVATRATLVVVPPALASQWVDEIRKSCVPARRLAVATFVGDDERRGLVAPRREVEARIRAGKRAEVERRGLSKQATDAAMKKIVVTRDEFLAARRVELARC